MADEERYETETLEEGDIFFIYRPQVEEDEPTGLSDVQRFHVALRPRGGHNVRLLILGRKRLPEIGGHERLWGFVDAVTDSEEKLERALREQEYGTQTRGERRLPAAVPAGEGVYAITLENGQMHLVYVLELPEDPGPVQKEFNIAPEAAFVLSVKNPEKGQPRAAGLREQQKADYPDELQAEFRDRRFSREDARLLDYEGAEFIMVGARTDPERTYDLDLPAESEDYEHADAIRKLRLVRSRHPLKPLFTGGWPKE